MATAQVSWLDLIPGARQGVTYLMGQVAAFQRLPARFTNIETAAVAAKRAAESRGDLTSATDLALSLQAVSTIRDQFGQTLGKLADVLDGLRTSGFGLTPVELAQNAATVAAEMAAEFAATDQAQGAVYATAQNVMTPDEFQQLQLQAPAGSVTSPLAAIGKSAAVVAIGVGALILFFARSRRRA